MRLIANKPCSFGGQKFYIGDKIPENLVVDARLQEKMGVITVANDTERVPAGELGTLFTQEQVEKMLVEAVDEAVNNTVLEMEQKQKEGFLSEGTVIIPVKGDSDGDNEQQTAVPATPEEIQQIFSIMQMNATDGAEAIAGVKSENVLILLHASDSRKTIKNAAKERADQLFSTNGDSNEASTDNATTGTNTEGADT
ncbi:hypothetical protein [Candidatus Merdisoma sp. JLR.KK006]|uniref:hypothetical protein n=1 Tax=Candidatus Merdisoma sp. JLR.KK006 TaxID=3112626 RepID=UPI002FF2DC48